ncbi:unnamed protein product [Gordionus sp. m RMFG-2023]|uniref:PAT complex subunit CCDC47-like n=1 Tax=Gordionus sp. m RMFG-2023 TaxID=3053472 RepID=UPI0030DF447F
MIIFFLCFTFLLTYSYSERISDTDETDFAEFDEIEEEIEIKTQYKNNINEDECKGHNCPGNEKKDLHVDEVDVDDEEMDNNEDLKSQTKPPPQLKINQVPIHFRSNWDSYYVEMILMTGLIIYLVNFITGRAKNSKLANEWFDVHKDIFETNFLLIGDDSNIKTSNLDAIGNNSIKNDSKEDEDMSNMAINSNNGNCDNQNNHNGSEEDNETLLTKDSENIYLLWCSGRTGCEGMLSELKLVKRQDIFSLVTSYFKHETDKIIITVYMNNEDMDTYILAIGQKKSINFLAKEMKDLSLYCPEKKGGEKLGLPPGFQYVSEIGEAILSLLDNKIMATFNKFATYIDYIHFSDQYAGKKLPDEANQAVKPQDTKKCLRFCFSIPSNKWNSKEELSTLKPLLLFVFYCVDKVQRFRLSKEAKIKSGKNRFKVEDTFFKQQHTQRQEAAQVRREEKRKAEKERLLNEEDPLKQKKLEEKEYKRELKRRNPKFKQLKIRAL